MIQVSFDSSEKIISIHIRCTSMIIHNNNERALNIEHETIYPLNMAMPQYAVCSVQCSVFRILLILIIAIQTCSLMRLFTPYYALVVIPMARNSSKMKCKENEGKPISIVMLFTPIPFNV